jgi:hypothetical protein
MVSWVTMIGLNPVTPELSTLSASQLTVRAPLTVYHPTSAEAASTTKAATAVATPRAMIPTGKSDTTPAVSTRRLAAANARYSRRLACFCIRAWPRPSHHGSEGARRTNCRSGMSRGCPSARCCTAPPSHQCRQDRFSDRTAARLKRQTEKLHILMVTRAT